MEPAPYWRSLDFPAMEWQGMVAQALRINTDAAAQGTPPPFELLEVTLDDLGTFEVIQLHPDAWAQGCLVRANGQPSAN